jgi:hypothetical protein
VKILLLAAVHAQRRQTLGQRRVVGGQRAAVAVPPEVLAGEEAEAAYLPDTARSPPLVFGADRLCGVLDDGDTALVGSLHDRVHVGAAAEQVHRDNRANLGTRGQRFQHVGDVDVERRLLDIGKDRDGPDARHGAGRREERVRCGEDFVPRPDIQREQRQDESVRSVGTPHRIFALAVRGDLLLEFLDVLAEDEFLRVHDPDDFLQNLIADLLMLRLQIE